MIQPRHEFPNSIRLQQPPNTASPFTVEEALYVLGKNILGKNVTDRIFPVAKTIAKGVGQVGQGLSTFGELIPPVEFDGSPLKLLPGRKIKRAYINYRIVWKTTRTKDSFIRELMEVAPEMELFLENHSLYMKKIL